MSLIDELEGLEDILGELHKATAEVHQARIQLTTAEEKVREAMTRFNSLNTEFLKAYAICIKATMKEENYPG